MNIENVDMFLKTLKKKSRIFNNTEKCDGITLYFEAPEKANIKPYYKKISDIIKDITKESFSIEEVPNRNNCLFIQFPNLEPKYSDDVIEKLYIEQFKILISDIIRLSDKKIFDKTKLINDRNIFVKSAITCYYRSNVNQYKHDINEFLQDNAYRSHIEELYIETVNSFDL